MRKLAVALALSLLPIACVVQEGDEDGVEDSSEEEAIARPREGTPEALAILSLVNERDAASLKSGTGLSTRVINGIVERRLFPTVAAVDAVPYVGAASIQRLLAMATREGYLAEQKTKKLEVIFSPQPIDPSLTHTARIVKELAATKKTIDLAMYSLSDSAVMKALADAMARGVKVRVIYDGASEDRKLTGDALASSRSGQLERAGADVRWVNKIMHHKFAILDGGRVISGSGNWSTGAATRYDENTLFFSGYPEITKRMQREFDLLWTYSRDFSLTMPAAVTPVTSISDSELREDPNTHATFTSPNFTAKGDTFTTNRGNTVSTMLVAAIRDAKTSIHVASGHLRSRPVAEALIEKHRTAPSVDIKVMLDGQEYISRTSHNFQLKELEQCLAVATTETRKSDCLDKGFLFGLQVADAGIDVRYKYYAYRWDVSYAKQLHHKFLIIDGRKLLTGSYNLSDNAEHDTFENVLMFEGAEFTALASAYEANFAKLWELGRNEGRLDALKTVVTSGATIPLVFEPLTLDWAEVTSLKSLIRDNCPEVDSEAFRTDPIGHQLCPR